MTAGAPAWEGLPEREGLSELKGLSELAGAGSPEPAGTGLRARVRAVAEFERDSDDCGSAAPAFSGERRCSSDMTWTS